MFELTGTGFIRVSGPDARDYLHRQLSSSIKDLPAGAGRKAALMTGDGRMVADMIVLCLAPDAFLLIVSPAGRERLAERLEKYIIMENVSVGDVSDAHCAYGVDGPHAPAVVKQALAAGVEQLEFGSHVKALLEPGTTVARCDLLGMRGYVVFAGIDRRQNMREILVRAAGDMGGSECGIKAWHTLRIEGGVPLFGLDLDTTIIPLEADLYGAVDFTKGCFPGQEIVARINNLGHPAKKLVGFTLSECDLPQHGAAVVWGGKDIGRITSSTYSPTLVRNIALGYVKWDYREPDTQVEVMINGKPVPAIISKLPFVS